MKIFTWLFRRRHKQQQELPDLPPFQKGGWIRLRGPHNPFKGRLKIGSSYQILDMTCFRSKSAKNPNYRRTWGWVLIRDDRDMFGHYDINQFELAPEPEFVRSAFGSKEYDEVMQVQDVMEKINGV